MFSSASNRAPVGCEASVELDEDDQGSAATFESHCATIGEAGVRQPHLGQTVSGSRANHLAVQ